jgi:aspartate aminotransferase
MATVTPSLRSRLRDSIAPFMTFFSGPFADLNLQADVANFAVGNPHEMPMPEYVDALKRHLEPQNKDWFAYKLSEPDSKRVVAASLTRQTGMDWDPADVAMTHGGFAALAVAMRSVIEQSDEAIFLSPPWFFYEMLILAAGGEPIRVRLAPPRFDLDLDAIGEAVNARTRVVLINTPHNPSGRVYPLGDLKALADVLTEASARIGHPIWLISDEPYNRILFDGREFHSPAEVYAHTIITYSYGKTLLAPGQRIGYVTVPPTLPERAELLDEIFIQQFATGYAFPNALLQHALTDLEELSIDIGSLERRRDRLVPALRDLGYEPTTPEGTFYVMARSPLADDVAFSDLLARHRVLVLPGTIVEVPGWFRISLTANDQMVEDGIPRFAAAMKEVSA